MLHTYTHTNTPENTTLVINLPCLQKAQRLTKCIILSNDSLTNRSISNWGPFVKLLFNTLLQVNLHPFRGKKKAFRKAQNKQAAQFVDAPGRWQFAINIWITEKHVAASCFKGNLFLASASGYEHQMNNWSSHRATDGRGKTNSWKLLHIWFAACDLHAVGRVQKWANLLYKRGSGSDISSKSEKKKAAHVC